MAQAEVLDASGERAGGYEVDVSRGQRVGDVSGSGSRGSPKSVTY